MARLKDMYHNKIAPALKGTFHYSSPMAIPRLEKIIVSMGVGKAVQDKKFMDHAFKDMTVITAQKPLICHAFAGSVWITCGFGTHFVHNWLRMCKSCRTFHCSVFAFCVTLFP